MTDYTMKVLSTLVLVILALVVCPSVARAGDGVVALQTADPSCPDDSGAIYVDCANGTVTDNRTGLVWLRNANCWIEVDWHEAMEIVASLSDLPASSVTTDHDCDLSDGSSPGEWRLPSVTEWEAMIADAVALGCLGDHGGGGPSITNDAGTGCWGDGASSFKSVESGFYWSSTSLSPLPDDAWLVNLGSLATPEGILSAPKDTAVIDIIFWPVRGGQ